MAFPILAKLSFLAPGVGQNIDKIRGKFNQLKQSGQKVGAGVAAMGQGVRGLTLATAPMAAGVGLATATFAGFEKQMSIVKSLSGDITDNEFAAMNSEAKRLGATTAFSARQAAEGLQFLALAGFTATEQVESLGTVLTLASAGSLDLARASDIATDSMSALAPIFDKNASKVQRLTFLSDQMALVQSKTNTNIEQLGEAIKFGGAALANAKIPLEEILASMGALANAGLKGSIGGTSLTNMFNKLQKPSEKAAEFMEQNNIALTNADGKFKSMPVLVSMFTKSLNKIPDAAKRGAAASELFGVRGQRAFFALQNEGPVRLAKLIGQLGNATGTAAAQAKERLNNLAGSFTILKSATEGILIEIGGIFGKALTKPIRRVADLVGGITLAFQILGATTENQATLFKEMTEIFGKEGAVAILDFVVGFAQGFKEAKETITSIITTAKDFFNEMAVGFGGTNVNIGNLVAKIVTFGAILAPVFAGIMAAMFVLPPIIGAIGGAFTVLGALISAPFLIAIAVVGILAAIVFKFRSEIFSFVSVVLDKLVPVWEVLKTSAMTVFAAISQVFGELMDTAVQAFQPIQEAFALAFGEGEEGATSFADTLISVINFLTPIIVGAVKVIGQGIGFIFRTIGNVVGPAMTLVVDAFLFLKALLFGTTEDTQEAFENLGTSIGNFFGSLLNVASDLIGTVIDMFGTMFASVTEGLGLSSTSFDGFWGNLKKNGMAAISGIGDFFSSILTGMENTLTGWVDNIIAKFKGMVSGLGDLVTENLPNPISGFKNFFGFGDDEEVIIPNKGPLNPQSNDLQLATSTSLAAEAAKANTAALTQKTVVAYGPVRTQESPALQAGSAAAPIIVTSNVIMDSEVVARGTARVQRDIAERSGENLSGRLRTNLEKGSVDTGKKQEEK